jgi:hypothetical protein
MGTCEALGRRSYPTTFIIAVSRLRLAMRTSIALIVCGLLFISIIWSAGGSGPVWGIDAVERESEDRWIEAALDSPVSIDFNGTSLVEALESVTKHSGVQWVVDKRALDDMGLKADELFVSARLHDIRLRFVLRRMLAPHELTFLVHDQVLYITTTEQASQMLTTKVYDVYDLLVAPWTDVGDVPVMDEFDFDGLIDGITSTVEPTQWDTVGGPGSIAPFHGGFLIVAQTYDVHRKIDDILTQLRTARKNRGLASPGPAAVPPRRTAHFDYRPFPLIRIHD